VCRRPAHRKGNKIARPSATRPTAVDYGHALRIILSIQTLRSGEPEAIVRAELNAWATLDVDEIVSYFKHKTQSGTKCLSESAVATTRSVRLLRDM